MCLEMLTPNRLLLYGHYCSQVETATKHLDKLSSMREDIRMKLEVRKTPKYIYLSIYEDDSNRYMMLF